MGAVSKTQIRTQIIFWGITSLILFTFVWMFKAVLTPFVLGAVIAYLLNPLLKRFSQKGIKRTTGTILILSLFFVILTVIIILVAPIIARESAQLVDDFPGYLDKLFEMAKPHIAWVQEATGADYITDSKAFLKENVSKILSISGGIAGGLAAGGQAVLGMLTTFVLTPLVAFYMMKEWPAITKWVESLMPRDKEKTIKGLIHQIDTKVAGFIRGQLLVAFFLGIIYAVALTIAGLNYGFLIGIMAGFLSIIPLVGSTVGLVVSIAVAWFQAGDIQYVLIIAAIFAVGQIVEGNVLSPKLLGDSVGLHPLWILFALMAGGSLFGILGMLLAVPVAAIIGVLASFAIAEYKGSSLYNDKSTKPKTKKKA